MAQPDHLDNVAERVEITEKPDAGSSSGPLKVGQLVDAKYEILELVGTGGMSSVYKARQIFTKQIVALKVLSPTIAARQDSVQRFRHEARATAKLNHPGIVRMYDFDVVDGLPYLTMDFVEGKSLSALIKENQGLPPKRVIAIFVQLCDALAHAHAEGVLHRDLKPSNVIVSEIDGRDVVKVVDFGIAKMESEDTQGLTRTGEVFGSPFYMSPEQCQGHKLDGRSDIYSLGCMLFESLTGQAPFQGSNVYATIRMQMEDVPASFRSCKRSLFGALADQLQSITFRAMQKDARNRFQSMTEFGEALKQSQTSSPLHHIMCKLAPTTFKRKANPYRLTISLLLACFLFSAIAFLIIAVRSPGRLDEWLDVAKAISHPPNTPMEKWRSQMDLGMRRMNNDRLQDAETSLKQAAITAKELPDKQYRTLPLKQLRILYHIAGNREAESQTSQQIASLSGRKTMELENAERFEAIALISDHPDKEQAKTIHQLIAKSLRLAWQYEGQNNGVEGRTLLRKLEAKVQRSLEQDDPALLNLRTYLCWSHLDYAAADRLAANTNLTDRDRALLQDVQARGDYDKSNFQESAALISKCVSVLRKDGPTIELAKAQQLQGQIASRQENFGVAIASYREAINTFKNIGNAQRASECMRELCDSLTRTGRINEAYDIIQNQLSSLNINEINDRALAASEFELLSYVSNQLGKPSLPQVYKSIELAQTSMDPGSTQYKSLLRYLTPRCWDDGNFQTLVGLSKQLQALSELSTPMDGELKDEARDMLACSYQALNQHDDAQRVFNRRISEFLAAPADRLPLCNEWFVDGCEKIATSVQTHQITSKLSDTIQSKLGRSDLANETAWQMRWLARIYFQTHNLPYALKTYQQALSFASTHDLSGMTENQLLIDYAYCLKGSGKTAQALEMEKAARDALAGQTLYRKKSEGKKTNG